MNEYGALMEQYWHMKS